MLWVSCCWSAHVRIKSLFAFNPFTWTIIAICFQFAWMNFLLYQSMKLIITFFLSFRWCKQFPFGFSIWKWKGWLTVTVTSPPLMLILRLLPGTPLSRLIGGRAFSKNNGTKRLINYLYNAIMVCSQCIRNIRQAKLKH